MKIYYITGNKRKIDRARVIAEKVSGENGWGMDKIFIPKGVNKTKAELSDEERIGVCNKGHWEQLMEFVCKNK
ncbi:hypothetical protein KJ953_03905 [Patescibacteria group bacterium]|nr:hypothetical protein [Patescibacteria group bacterium]MBU1256267.1 hypothetical protein [Patescibacteria group bacterium]MBU1457797.1 hypothetical protein [Patescibacteria group bacterium]